MASMAAVQFKIMPESPDTDLEKIKVEVKEKIEAAEGVFSTVEEEPIAFGLKALVFSLAYPEEKEIDELGNVLNGLEGVSSADYGAGMPRYEEDHA